MEVYASLVILLSVLGLFFLSSSIIRPAGYNKKQKFSATGVCGLFFQAGNESIRFLYKKAGAKKIISALIVIFFCYFIFFSVMPGEEKVLPFVCAADDNGLLTCSYGTSCAYTGNCDNSIYGQSGTCTDCTYWNIGGSGDSTGNPVGGATLCCQDDNGESREVLTCAGGAGCTTNAADDACCNVNTDCVYSGVCYAAANLCAPYNSNLRVSCSASQWSLLEDCSTSSSADSDGGDVPQTAGTVTDYTTCASGAACNSNAYADTCVSTTQLTEYYNNAATYASKTYTCSGTYPREVVASDTDGGNDPTNVGTCTGGSGATCSSNAFTQTAGSSGTDACSGTCGAGANSCIFREYYPADSADACSGLDTCTYQDYDADTNSNTCTTCKSASDWNIGGETASASCCGDDNNENNIIATFNMTSMDNPGDGTNACCLASNSCSDNNWCYVNGNSTYDADSDGDYDYCNAGTWQDCIDDSMCSGGQICSNLYGDCINPYGFIRIKNLGITGIENVSDEFTSIRNVFLDLNYTVNATACRYINYDYPSNEPASNLEEWTDWEQCVRTRLWFVTENSGIKTVFYQINYSKIPLIVTLNDTITYNYTGAGLDTTPPNPATIIDGDYTNNNQSITISWYNASDPESEILNLPLRYDYVLFLINGTILDSYSTIETTRTSDVSAFSLNHSTIVYANVTVINSAGLTATTMSDGLTIDLEKPIILTLTGSFYNLSSLAYNSLNSLPSEDTWVYAKSANFTWNGFDALSNSVIAYSYLLSQNPDSPVDEIPEGSIGNFGNEKTKQFGSLQPGKYYFRVKAKDEAGNWGDIDSINFSIDSTPPSRPEILSENRIGENIIYTWSSSSDPESSVLKYMINLTNSDGDIYQSNETMSLSFTYPNVTTGSYNATVGAVNGAGIWRWSNEEETISDFTPPEIRATPNRTVIVTEPILKAWTDEKAICTYNSTYDNRMFLYTNTTYHEAKASYMGTGAKFVTITCTDMSGNFASLDINFTIVTDKTPTGIVAPDPVTAYSETMTTFTINLLNGTIELAGAAPDTFVMSLDDTPVDISVFDVGNGYYNVSFIAPKQAGDYSLVFDIDSFGFSPITLTVTKLYLGVSYSTPGIVPVNTPHITYNSQGSNAFGIASDADENEIVSYSNSGSLNLSEIRLSDNSYIFNTKPGAYVNGREDLIKAKRLLSQVNPSFGFKIDETNIIEFILRYDNVIIISEMGNELKRGYYNSLMRNSYSDEGEKQIRFIKPGSEEAQDVLQG